jgi:hypothetical protein
MTSRRLLFATTVLGVAVFLLVVVALHLAQRNYDPYAQYMSELVFGRFGAVLVVAFFGLALAAVSVAVNLRLHGSAAIMIALPGLAGACFIGAGVLTLETSAAIHIAFVALAFVLCGLAMYVLPRSVAAFSGVGGHLSSWGALAAMALATALGNEVLMPGVAQRLAAAALLWWFLLVAWRLSP